MKVKKWNRYCTAIIIFGASCITPMSTQADCGSTYTAAMAQCSTDQQNRDNLAYNTYVASYWNAQNTYTNTVNQDAIAQALAQQTALNTFYTFVGNPQVFNDIGSCGSADVAATKTAVDTYNQAVVACGTNTQCVCQAGAACIYSEATAEDQATKCANDAQNTYNQSVANATATQNQNDRQANAAFINGSGTANATYVQSGIMSDNYTAPLCGAQAGTTCANCELDADCSQNPGNCCVDGCEKTYNNNCLSAYTAYVNSVGPADAQNNHDQIMWRVTQSHDDWVSYAQQEYTIDVANATYQYNQTLAWNIYQYTTSVAAEEWNKDVSLCGCNSTSDSQYNACVATANATQTATDNNAQAAYNQQANVPPATPTGNNWNTWNSTVTTATNALQAAYTTHALTEQTCVQNAQNTFNAVYKSGVTAYNNTCAAAYQSWTNCCNGCNPSKG